MEVSEHNHDANVPALIAKLQADEAIEHAIQNPSIDPHQIFAEFENKDCHNLEIAMKKPSMRSFVKTINKARAKASALQNKLIKSEWILWKLKIKNESSESWKLSTKKHFEFDYFYYIYQVLIVFTRTKS